MAAEEGSDGGQHGSQHGSRFCSSSSRGTGCFPFVDPFSNGHLAGGHDAEGANGGQLFGVPALRQTRPPLVTQIKLVSQGINTVGRFSAIEDNRDTFRATISEVAEIIAEAGLAGTEPDELSGANAELEAFRRRLEGLL